MLLSFPYMHADLVGEDVPGMSFFDPGMSDEPMDNGFRPEDLPLDPKSSRALINDCINFGEQFKDPSEMAYFGAQTADDFYEGSSMSIQAQLSRSFDDGKGTKQERDERDVQSRAQFVLLLGYFFEERMIELAGLEKGIKDSWKTMDTTIGVDDEDRLDQQVVHHGVVQSHTAGVSDEQQIPLPWKRIVESLPVFIPENAILVCSDQEIITAWKDMEIEFVKADAGLGLPYGAHIATLPAWKFSGRRSAPSDMPSALKEVSVAILN